VASYGSVYNPCNLLICNKKTPLFYKKQGICQPVHISLQHGYTGWNLFNGLFHFAALLSRFSFQIYYFHEMINLLTSGSMHQPDEPLFVCRSSPFDGLDPHNLLRIVDLVKDTQIAHAETMDDSKPFTGFRSGRPGCHRVPPPFPADRFPVRPSRHGSSHGADSSRFSH
jgi:hypothetical protein